MINNNKRSNNNIKPNANKISYDNDFNGYLDDFYDNKNNFQYFSAAWYHLQNNNNLLPQLKQNFISKLFLY